MEYFSSKTQNKLEHFRVGETEVQGCDLLTEQSGRASLASYFWGCPLGHAVPHLLVQTRCLMTTLCRREQMQIDVLAPFLVTVGSLLRHLK